MKKHLPLIVGIALPILFIIVISVVVFVPSFFVRPAYSFLYTLDASYGYGTMYRNSYVVENGRLSFQANPSQGAQAYVYKGDLPPLYMYDVKTDSIHAVTLSEAQAYTLDPGPSSPDGYTVAYEYNSDGVFALFGSNGSPSNYFIEKGSAKRKLTGLAAADPYSYQGSFKLIGWIKQ